MEKFKTKIDGVEYRFSWKPSPSYLNHFRSMIREQGKHLRHNAASAYKAWCIETGHTPSPDSVRVLRTTTDVKDYERSQSWIEPQKVQL